MSLSELSCGYVVAVQIRGTAAHDAETTYWCGHMAWDSFVNWLHYRDPGTGEARPAPVAVYSSRADAVAHWQAFVADHRPRYGDAVVDAVCLARIPDLADLVAGGGGEH